MRCQYTGCNITRNFSSSFFLVPKDNRREVWLKHAQIKNLNKTKAITFCDKHFYSKDITICGTLRRLKKGAIPMSCATVCDCTETQFDDMCLKMMNPKPGETEDVTQDTPQSINILTMNTDARKYHTPQSFGGTMKLKPTNTATTHYEMVIDKPKANALDRQNLSEQPVSKNAAKISELQGANMINGNQMRIESDKKKVKCLEAVVKYTSLMQSKLKGLDSFIQAHNHLTMLLDKVVYEWFLRAQKHIEVGIITDELLIKIAHDSKQIFCIQNFDADHEWLNTFKTKYSITDLDMKMLHIENNKSIPSLDINDVIFNILRMNPVTLYFGDVYIKTESNTDLIPQNQTISLKTDIKTETVDIPNEDADMEEQIAISNDEQAKLHLKPLEEYVLLKDNFRAMELISQLKEMFSPEIKKEET